MPRLAEQATVTTIQDERALITRAKDGDLDAFSALVMLYQERAVHIAYSIVGNFEDARDAAQETFIKAHAHLKNFKEESSFYTWLYRILVNTCKDFLRNKKNRSGVFFWLNREEDEEGDIFSTIASEEKNAPQKLINQELGSAIQQAMEQLPFQQRSAFALRYLEGLSLLEISESMRITEGAVKATLWQAGQKMRRLLQDFNRKESGE